MSTNRSYRRSTWAWMLIGLAAPLLTSCVMPAQPTPPGAVKLESYRISCDDAHRFAARSLKARGFGITAVDRGASGGTVEGRKESGESASIRVSCPPEGVTIQPSGGLWQEQGMRVTFSRLVEAGDRIWPPPTSPQVRMELLVGAESKLEFPQQIDSLGLVAVSVRVINGGARTIRIDPRAVRARTAAGASAGALSEKGVLDRLSGVSPAIDGKILRAAKLRQGEEARGFVFFPAGVYTSAMVKIIDDQTNEADEFEVSLVPQP